MQELNIPVRQHTLWHVLTNKYPCSSENQKLWCQDRPPVTVNQFVRCSREPGHSGPHRYQSNEYLMLWFSEGQEEEEAVLETCIRLGVVPK